MILNTRSLELHPFVIVGLNERTTDEPTKNGWVLLAIKTPFDIQSGERWLEGAEELLRIEFHARQLHVDCCHFHAAK